MPLFNNEKAFDRVQHGKLMKLLAGNIHTIGNLYRQQKAAVKVNDEMAETMEVGEENSMNVQIHFPLLNLYCSNIFGKTMVDSKGSIILNTLSTTSDNIIHY